MECLEVLGSVSFCRVVLPVVLTILFVALAWWRHKKLRIATRPAPPGPIHPIPVQAAL